MNETRMEDKNVTLLNTPVHLKGELAVALPPNKTILCIGPIEFDSDGTFVYRGQTVEGIDPDVGKKAFSALCEALGMASEGGPST